MRPNQLLSARDILYILFKRKRAVAVIVATSLILSLGYVTLVRPSYRGSIEILVRLGKEKLSAVRNLADTHPNVLFQERTQNINNELEILKTLRIGDEVFARIEAAHEELKERPRSGITAVRWFVADTLEKVIDVVCMPAYFIGLLDKKSPQERFVGQLARSIEFQAIEDTDVIEVGFWWWDPEFTALVLDEFSRAYIQHRIQVHEPPGIEEFYADQIKLFSQELEEHEQRLNSFVNDAGISALEHQKELLLEEISGLEVKRTQLALELEQTRIKAVQVRKMRDTPGAWVETPELDDSTMSQFASLDQLYFTLVKERRDKLAFREIRTLESELEALRTQKAASVLNSIRVLESVALGEIGVVQQAIESRRVRLAELVAATVPLSALRREFKVSEATYLLYRRKAEEHRISASLDSREITSVSLIERPRPPEASSWPRKNLIVGISAGVGLLLAFAFCFISEFLNHTFRDTEDVAEVLGLRVLTTVPDLGDLEPRSKEGTR